MSWPLWPHRRHGPPASASTSELESTAKGLRQQQQTLDAQLAPLARQGGHLGHPRWGPLMRAGNDKSHLAHQLERSADIYTSRVSNFLLASPYAFLRSIRGSMPHDPAPPNPAVP